MRLSLVSTILGLSLQSLAQGVAVSGGVATQVNPVGPIEMMNVVIPGQTTRNYANYFVVNVRNSCHGNNVRPSAGRFLVPTANIRFSFNLVRPTGNMSVSVTYSGSTGIALPGGSIGVAGTNPIPAAGRVPAAMRASYFRNVLRMEIPIATPTTIGPDGLVIENQAPRIENPVFFQLVAPPPAFPAQPPYYSFACASSPTGICTVSASGGTLGAKVNILQPKGSYSAEVQVSFPGQDEYCNGNF